MDESTGKSTDFSALSEFLLLLPSNSMNKIEGFVTDISGFGEDSRDRVVGSSGESPGFSSMLTVLNEFLPLSPSNSI